MGASPCLTCGACCAAFCVSFPETETDQMPGGYVPIHLTVPGPRARRSMKGTLGSLPRCAALEGRVGMRVRCRIYENRPSPCREFSGSWEKGNSLCDWSRALFGFQPFSPIPFSG